MNIHFLSEERSKVHSTYPFTFCQREDVKEHKGCKEHRKLALLSEG